MNSKFILGLVGILLFTGCTAPASMVDTTSKCYEIWDLYEDPLEDEAMDQAMALLEPEFDSIPGKVEPQYTEHILRTCRSTCGNSGKSYTGVHTCEFENPSMYSSLVPADNAPADFYRRFLSCECD